ncbi:MAG: hypothetical protein Kow0090_19050 [Myxococcota bacterium]
MRDKAMMNDERKTANVKANNYSPLFKPRTSSLKPTFTYIVANVKKLELGGPALTILTTLHYSISTN